LGNQVQQTANQWNLGNRQADQNFMLGQGQQQLGNDQLNWNIYNGNFNNSLNAANFGLNANQQMFNQTNLGLNAGNQLQQNPQQNQQFFNGQYNQFGNAGGSQTGAQGSSSNGAVQGLGMGGFVNSFNNNGSGFNPTNMNLRAMGAR
jgi:hypothetical protein